MYDHTHQGANTPGRGLTPEERATLRVALREGYSDLSRETTHVDVVDEAESDAEVPVQRSARDGGVRESDIPHDPAVRPDGGADTVTLDRIFDALSHPYRRRILLLVSEHNPRDEDEFSVDDLATESDDLELLTTELYHMHLPKLAQSGYIEWDEDTHTIRRGPNFDEIAPLLRLMHEHQDELPNGWP